MDDNNNNNDELICPITYELFHDPVRANDGHTYEREAITEWIKQNGTSPFTRQILHVEDLSTDNHLKDLTEQYRNSKGISTISTDSIGSSSHCYISRKIHPRESNQIEQRITQNSECRKRSWVLVFCIITIITGILCLSIIFIITTNRESNKQLEPSILSSTSYPLYSRKTTLLQINNKTRFNYTYYSYSYTAISSHDMIKFSFHPDLSSWCLDDVGFIRKSRAHYFGPNETQGIDHRARVKKPSYEVNINGVQYFRLYHYYT